MSVPKYSHKFSAKTNTPSIIFLEYVKSLYNIFGEKYALPHIYKGSGKTKKKRMKKERNRHLSTFLFPKSSLYQFGALGFEKSVVTYSFSTSS